MLNYSSFVLLNLFLWILTVAAVVPQTVYRGDTRKPTDIKNKNGFTTQAGDRGRPEGGDVIAHAQGGYNPRAGFISCSSNLEVTTTWIKQKQGRTTGSGWVYHIDTRGISGKFVDVAEE